MRRYLSLVFLLLVFAGGQVYNVFVTSTNSFDATACGNSHKIATQDGEWMCDTIYIVYHSGDSIYYVNSTDEGFTWLTPYFLYPGTNPALDIDVYGLRHIAWQQQDSITGNYDVFYDCLDDYSPPVNVSQSISNSILPDLVIDSAIVAHITWTEDFGSTGTIYYRSCQNGILSDTVRLSYSGKNGNSSISIFQPNDRICVSWYCVDSSSYTPYHIFYRYKETDWSGINELAGYWKALRHPSLDFSHGDDSLSACWEDSTSDNLEATFYGGNQGGGYPTSGRSTYPVISTVGQIYSYYFWQEDSSGSGDIYCHLYYAMIGWYGEGSLRERFGITEPVRFPNVCGAYLTWTQGSGPPYEIWFACFGYPIGIEETRDLKPQFDKPGLTIGPNPFIRMLSINCQFPNAKIQTMPKSLTAVKIYNATGQIVKSFNLAPRCSLLITALEWDGRDDAGKNAPPGIYFVGMPGYGLMAKAIKLR